MRKSKTLFFCLHRLYYSFSSVKLKLRVCQLSFVSCFLFNAFQYFDYRQNMNWYVKKIVFEKILFTENIYHYYAGIIASILCRHNFNIFDPSANRLKTSSTKSQFFFKYQIHLFIFFYSKKSLVIFLWRNEVHARLFKFIFKFKNAKLLNEILLFYWCSCIILTKYNYSENKNNLTDFFLHLLILGLDKLF